MPARGFKPRDKALVEEAVDLVEQWIVEPSRDETFRTIMDPGRLHRRTGHVAQPPARHSGAGFEAGTVRGRGTTDAAALLPAEPSGPCQWRKAKVLSDTAISASRRMILLRAPRTGAEGPWT